METTRDFITQIECIIKKLEEKDLKGEMSPEDWILYDILRKSQSTLYKDIPLLVTTVSLGTRYERYLCKCCGNIIPIPIEYLYEYCPHCGHRLQWPISYPDKH